MIQFEQIGIFLTVGLVVAFYMRLAIRQNSRRKQQATIQNNRKTKGKKKENELQAMPFFFGARVASWPWVFAACIFLMTGGSMSIFISPVTPFWWLPVDIGIIILWIFLV